MPSGMARRLFDGAHPWPRLLEVSFHHFDHILDRLLPVPGRYFLPILDVFPDMAFDQFAHKSVQSPAGRSHGLKNQRHVVACSFGLLQKPLQTLDLSPDLADPFQQFFPVSDCMQPCPSFPVALIYTPPPYLSRGKHFLISLAKGSLDKGTVPALFDRLGPQFR